MRWLIPLILILSACGNDVGISEDEHNAVIEERDTLTDQLADTENEVERAQAELDNTNELITKDREEIGSLKAEIESLQIDIESKQREVGLQQEKLDAAHDAFVCIKLAEDALQLENLWITEEDYNALVAWGFPIEVADEILKIVDSNWYPWENFAGSTSFFEWGNRVNAADDPDIDAAWRGYLDAPLESLEELYYNIEFDLRLALMELRCLQDGLDTTVPKE